jgi:AraC-like DNA-binding protein
MLKIHLIKAAQALPFIRVLDGHGSPVRIYSERVGLPIDAIYNSSGVIGEFAIWRFIDLAARYEKLDLFGYEVAQAFPVTSAEGLGGHRMREATSLKVLLEYFIEDVQSESTGCDYSLITDDEGTWLVRDKMFGENHDNWQVELYMLAIFIQIIRLCTGSDWLPRAIKSSSSKTAQQLPDEWAPINFSWGNNDTRVMLSDNDLGMPLINHGDDGGSIKDKNNTSAPLSFEELVKTQVNCNLIGLENAAQQTGLSPKTLKRKLAEEKTSYSEILDKVRLDIARSRLAKSETPITIIARELGYEHPANFTRAFKRLSGVTPLAYRKQFQ